ncbi:hypothetical protein [Sporosarcina sp. A2]
MGTTEALVHTAPYAALFLTWTIVYCKSQERKEARKEQGND